MRGKDRTWPKAFRAKTLTGRISETQTLAWFKAYPSQIFYEQASFFFKLLTLNFELYWWSPRGRRACRRKVFLAWPITPWSGHRTRQDFVTPLPFSFLLLNPNPLHRFFGRQKNGAREWEREGGRFYSSRGAYAFSFAEWWVKPKEEGKGKGKFSFQKPIREKAKVKNTFLRQGRAGG